jgi:hypothetical protein
MNIVLVICRYELYIRHNLYLPRHLIPIIWEINVKIDHAVEYRHRLAAPLTSVYFSESGARYCLHG